MWFNFSDVSTGSNPCQLILFVFCTSFVVLRISKASGSQMREVAKLNKLQHKTSFGLTCSPTSYVVFNYDILGYICTGFVAMFKSEKIGGRRHWITEWLPKASLPWAGGRHTYSYSHFIPIPTIPPLYPNPYNTHFTPILSQSLQYPILSQSLQYPHFIPIPTILPCYPNPYNTPMLSQSLQHPHFIPIPTILCRYALMQLRKYPGMHICSYAVMQAQRVPTAASSQRSLYQHCRLPYSIILDVNDYLFIMTFNTRLTCKEMWTIRLDT